MIARVRWSLIHVVHFVSWTVFSSRSRRDPVSIGVCIGERCKLGIRNVVVCDSARERAHCSTESTAMAHLVRGQAAVARMSE